MPGNVVAYALSPVDPAGAESHPQVAASTADVGSVTDRQILEAALRLAAAAAATADEAAERAAEAMTVARQAAEWAASTAEAAEMAAARLAA